jgi:mitogen-activated protein kinase 7
MADLQGRKVFKVFNQDFIVDERYTVTKELGQGAYGIVWYDSHIASRSGRMLTVLSSQRGDEYPNQ